MRELWNDCVHTWDVRKWQAIWNILQSRWSIFVLGIKLVILFNLSKTVGIKSDRSFKREHKILEYSTYSMDVSRYYRSMIANPLVAKHLFLYRASSIWCSRVCIALLPDSIFWDKINTIKPRQGGGQESNIRGDRSVQNNWFALFYQVNKILLRSSQ